MIRMTNLLEKLWDKLGIKKAHLVGNSLGGWIAWEFTLKNPERVQKLVLIDAAGFNTEDVPWVVSFARLPLAPYVVTGIAPRFAVRYLVETVYGNPELIKEETVTRYHELFLREGNGGAFFELSKTPLVNHSHLLSTLKMPVLILWGEKDQWISSKYAPKFHSKIPGSKLVTFPKLGHIPMEESPEETLKATLSFL
jgi:pimeloyl-ACP methyl ester carboxylesterase